MWTELESLLKVCKYAMKELITVSCKKCKKKSGALRELHVGTDKKCSELPYRLYLRLECVCCFQKTNGRVCALASCMKYWSNLINHRCCCFLRRSPFRNFTITETILKRTNSCPKTSGRSLKVRGRSIYCCCSQGQPRSALHKDIILPSIRVTFGYSGHW